MLNDLLKIKVKSNKKHKVKKYDGIKVDQTGSTSAKSSISPGKSNIEHENYVVPLNVKKVSDDLFLAIIECINKVTHILIRQNKSK